MDVTKQESYGVTSNDTAAQLDLELDDELLAVSYTHLTLPTKRIV